MLNFFLIYSLYIPSYSSRQHVGKSLPLFSLHRLKTCKAYLEIQLKYGNAFCFS